jgi:hypothetical protein
MHGGGVCISNTNLGVDHEKFIKSKISSAPPLVINNECSLTRSCFITCSLLLDGLGFIKVAIHSETSRMYRTGNERFTSGSSASKRQPHAQKGLFLLLNFLKFIFIRL